MNGRVLGSTLLTAVLALTLAACSGKGDRETTPSDGDQSHSESGKDPEAVPLRAGESFSEVTMPAAYEPSAPAKPGTDDYRCFLLDPGLDEPAFLTGADIQPDRVELVHHVILYKLPADSLPAAQRHDDRTDGDGWTCFGGTGLAGRAERTSEWLASWAPGTGEQIFPESTGYPMAVGDRIVMQVHYNLLAGDGTDRSTARLRLASGDAELEPLATALIAAPTELPCRPGVLGPLCDRDAALADLTKRFGPASGRMPDQLVQGCEPSRRPDPGPVQQCTITAPAPFTIHGAAGHMHLLGTSIGIELNPDTPRARTLLDVPVWNFDDQALDETGEPVRVERGDTLRVTCEHDQGLRDLLPELKGVPERYVMWGEGTSDEMCLGIMLTTA